MGVGVLLTEGAARVAALGIGHSIAYTAGVVVLSVGLSRRTGHAIVPRALPRAVAWSGVIGVAGWWVAYTLDPSGRLANAVLCTVIVAVGGALYLLGVRATGGRVERRPVAQPDVADLEPDSAEVEA
jgi:peptidoglycan biosynthesis protein MviN/MurJ (putative lipid II flippase)